MTTQLTTPPLTTPVTPPISVGGAFWSTLKRLAIAAGFVNFVWAVMFAWFGSTALAAIGVCSIIVYWVAYRLIEARQNSLAVILWWTEVVVHIYVATMLLGWSSAYYLYFLLCIPGLQVSSSRKRGKQGVLILVVLFFTLYIASNMVGPLAPLPEFESMIVAALNYLIIIAFFQASSSAYRDTVRAAEKKLRYQAMTDSLTGVSNRVHFQNRAATEIARARRDGSPVSLLLVDVDHFKKINDEYGHEAGDTVLKQIAKVLQSDLREVDVLARWGGEEFLIMLPSSDIDLSSDVAERLRNVIGSMQCDPENKLISATISIGVTALRENEEISAAVGRADKALYLSKSNGRNRVTVSP